MYRQLAALLLALLLVSGCAPARPAQASGDEVFSAAFRDRTSGIEVTGSGVVTRSLPDDNDGGRHQRFIVELSSGQTLLIAHNIDVAPRIDTLRVGEMARFHGVYEWNDQGGVVHWTHQDPTGGHEAGWIEYGGRRYQ